MKKLMLVLMVMLSVAAPFLLLGKQEQPAQQNKVRVAMDPLHCNACDSGIFTYYAEGDYRCSFCGVKKLYPATLLSAEDVK